MSSDFLTHQEELDFLKKLGFPVNPLNKGVNTPEEVFLESQKLHKQKESLKYPIDGMVVKLNDNSLVKALGVVGKTNRGWAAIKFPATKVGTQILDITWQVGRTGRVVPVAELEPVELEGTVVKRATLHNYQEFLNKDLRKGDTLVIRKAGDIIPEVVEVLTNLRQTDQAFDSPKKCPCCHTPLVKSKTGVDLYCPNTKDCLDQIVGRLSYFCQRNIADISGLSRQNLKKFIKLFALKDIPDLYNLPFDKIIKMEGFGEKSVTNLKKSIQKSKQILAEKFFAGLGIEGIGIEVAKLILEKLYEVD
jgi:DNA ligase (NAD+)